MKIYSAENIRAWDAYTIENEPISSVDLMERAATRCTKHILGSYFIENAAIFCGPGNNGGDGLVIARLLAERGINTTVFVLSIGSKSADFEVNFERLPKTVQLIKLSESTHDFDINADIIVDAIFGSGLSKIVDGWIGDVIDKINNYAAPTIAVDIPSGLFADQPFEAGSKVVKAHKTFTFQCPKMSFFFSESDEIVGEWTVVDIGLHGEFKAEAEALLVGKSDLKLKTKKRSDHKGSNGFLTIIAGLGGMPGAAILCSKAAFRTGCGYVGTSVANDVDYLALITSTPELLLIDAKSLSIPEKTSAIVVGPGIGTGEMGRKWIQACLDQEKPLLIDADGLNLLSENKEWLEQIPKGSILTPHLGELKRLIGDHDDSLELLNAQMEFSKQHGLYIIQKGPNSKLTCPNGELYINSTGNPGMATAGMGDVLSGVIGSLLAQGHEPKDAAISGMYLHGLAGDLVARKNGEYGMISSDVAEAIPQAIRAI